MLDIPKEFKVGFSDHSMGSFVPVVAMSVGASVMEKHFMLKRSPNGPDFSLEPHEFTEMVKLVRAA
ncbi:MAG: pseudaminic acid synthase [Cyclobacteriaceae bacterium]|jgi:pseudaminic acid synthase